MLYVAADTDTARRAAQDLAFLARRGGEATHSLPPLEPGETLLFSPAEPTPYAEAHPDRRATMGRAATLFHLAARLPWRFLVTTAAGLARRVVPPGSISAGVGRLSPGATVDVDEVARKLSASGYLRVPVVEDAGTFAVRGGLIDVWPASTELPVRAELDGDTITALRSFDPDNQRTLEAAAEVWLPPAREAVTTSDSVERARGAMRSLCDAVNLPSTKARQLVDDVASGRAFYGADGYLPAFFELEPLWSYLPDDTPVVVEEPTDCLRALSQEIERARAGEEAKAEAPHFPLEALYVRHRELDSWLEGRPVVASHRSGVSGGERRGPLESLESPPIDAPCVPVRDHADLARAVKAARASRGKQGALDPLVRRLEAWRDAGLEAAVSARTATQADRLATLLSHRGIRAIVDAAPGEEDDDAVRIVTGELSRGGTAPAEGFVLVTEEEIFGQRTRRKPTRTRSARSVLEDLRALEPGDHVVHAEHGIGKYVGLEHKSINGVTVDLLVVEYAGGDRLFLPVYRLNQIQKHSGGEGAPKLDRLGGQSFAKTKAKVERRVRQMADELLKLYAERNALERPPLRPTDDEYATFEATFPFEETRDQSLAIAEVNHDFEKRRVMDRLVCGDVGFGKTEVALRAAFRVALAGRQVALLCPTTVLAQQHYLTFASRLADYPIEVRALSRFQSKKVQTDTVRALKEGKVDVVIGTHRLLSKDVHFKRLGLLIVDEEQRFGVTHKERIKQLRTTIDVLTLSATPIPRTLQLAIGGLRDMSLISTPPVDRRAIRTITSRWDSNLIRDAVTRELSRGGQVFYVYNRVEDIYERAGRLRDLVPEARLAVAHGQMSETTLEKTMLQFVEGDFDVLVSTAIIESGLDIPRANTMIVDRADLFGLSQLYQLRGRVGRSSERAYCYLIVPPPAKLSSVAKSRIEALERYTDLGSGFHIASLDMELRGTGDLLGAEQSGFVASVGFDLFCQMLEEATHELRGEPLAHDVDPELSFDVDALLPEDYISEIGVRLSLYKRLASAADEADVADIASEMEDRFGPPPLDAKRYVELMRLKAELRRLRVLGCEASATSVTLHLREDTPLDPVAIGRLVARKKSAYKLTPDMRLTRRAQPGEALADGLVLADRMLAELSECVGSAPTTQPATFGA